VRKQLDECVEKLCEQGCNVVRENIEALEKGQALTSINYLNDGERIIVLEELKIIMSVYDERPENH